MVWSHSRAADACGCSWEHENCTDIGRLRTSILSPGPLRFLFSFVSLRSEVSLPRPHLVRWAPEGPRGLPGLPLQMFLYVPGLHAVCEKCWYAVALHNGSDGESGPPTACTGGRPRGPNTPIGAFHCWRRLDFMQLMPHACSCTYKQISNM